MQERPESKHARESAPSRETEPAAETSPLEHAREREPTRENLPLSMPRENLPEIIPERESHTEGENLAGREHAGERERPPESEQARAHVHLQDAPQRDITRDSPPLSLSRERV